MTSNARAFALCILASCVVATQTFAQSVPSAPSASQPTPSSLHYSVEDTPVGDLLDDARARAIIDKHIPGFSTGDQIDLARGMTLRAIQQYAPDSVTDEVLSKIQAELAKLPAEAPKR